MKKVLVVLSLIILPFISHAEEVTITVPVLNDDGYAGAPYPGSWDLIRESTYGRVDNSPEDALDVYSAALFTNTGYIAIYRSFLSFDTGTIPPQADIVSARLTVTPKYIIKNVLDQYSYISVLPSFQASESQATLDDIELCGNSITNPTTFADVDVLDFEENSTATIHLNDNGVDWITKGGITSLCLREGHDMMDEEITNSGYPWLGSGMAIHSSNQPVESYRPYLEITYSIDEQEEREYPLYTQIESPYPSLLETAQWADEQYANGSASDSCGTTIGECGCAITSLVMAARNAGIEEDILGDDVNPGNMNEYLESVSGYTSYGALRWLAAQAYFGEFTSGGVIASRFGAPVDRPSTGENVMSFIDAKLGEGNVTLLGFKNGHFVWLPEKTADSYVVNDPWWYNTLTANDDAGEKTKDYNNSFSDARALAISDTPVAFSGTDIEVHLQGTAELLFTRATGEQVGFENGTVVVDLEHASYGGAPLISLEGNSGSGGKHLLVYQAGDVFTIEVVGTGTGEFSMEFFTISASGEVTTFEFTGATLPGITSTFSFNLATGEVEELPISYEQFLTILGQELSGYSEQQQKFFTKWAEKIYSNMEEKTVAQAIQSIQVYKKLLVAKKVNSPFLTGALDLLRAGL